MPFNQMASKSLIQLVFDVGNNVHETAKIQVGIKWDVVGSIPTKGRKLTKEPLVRIEPTPKFIITSSIQSATWAVP